MSKDIRSYFLCKKLQKPKEEDDDVIPESPDVQIKNKKKESRKRRVIQDDSDEEIFATKKKPSSSDSNKTSKNKPKSPQKKIFKEVKATDLFGGPIKRTEPLVTKAKKKNTELGIHSDDEFDKSLLELDVNNDIEKVEQKQVESKDFSKTIKKEKQSPNKKSESSNSVHIEKEPNNEEFSPNHSDKNDNNVTNTDTEITKTESHKKIKKEASKDETGLKRDFSEFIDDSVTDNQTHDEQPKNKKRKLNKSLNDSVLTDEERHERRLHSAALYQKYLNRSGPKHLGSKEIPEGAPNCLKDCAFLLTGVLDSFERDEVIAAIAKYGGSIKNSISRKVTHVLAGDEAGPAKLAKAQDLGIKIINEDEFLEIIKKSSGKPSNNSIDNRKEVKKNKTPESKNSTKEHKIRNSIDKKVHSNNRVVDEEENSSDRKTKLTNGDVKDRKDREDKNKDSVKKVSPKDKLKTETTVKSEPSDKSVKKEIEQSKTNNETSPNKSALSSSLMWVDKYKPQNLKQIIGQHGEASNVKKLCNWLTKWYVNRKAKLPKPSPWAKNDDGGYYKAALLSGPPGVGKTTTVSLVCKELGFDMVEFNASDTRSKTLIKEQIGELLTTTSLSAYAKGDTGKQAVTKKHVLVMDEVDGMAGNEDRGGLQELIALIKTTSVPIICMCNDRNSQKMRSLVNYCYDLRFTRPRVDQIKSAMLSICFKEGVKVPPDVVAQLAVAAGQDVRQTLHMLSVWAADSSLADADRLRDEARRVRKDIKMGPWEAIRKVFSAEDHKTMSLNDKSDLFFSDYSLAPLFVQENYLSVVPHCDKKELLHRMSEAADSISLGDIVDARIRGSQAWSLLPIQAMYSSVIPGHHLSGHIGGQIQFPGWLGKNSRATKMHRLCQEIHAHTRLSTSGSKSSIYLDYAPYLRDAILNPLIKERSDGIPKSLEVLESYHLLREDLDSLTELSLWPGQRNPNILVDAKVKAAMTRTYNKASTARPYAPPAARRARTHEHDDDDDNDDDYGDDEHDDDPEKDALIKKKKSKETEKAGSSKEKASSSKEKATTSKKKKK
ncbi:replication factor C subunit 1 [Epargyreus clarus]|uniref:replication factor C subunit 1 n=1 Tax=Epargyreus clarus TaxID=520877 RepID=UPI003C2D8C5B